MHVRKFQEYLDRRAAPLTLTLELVAIDWGNTWNNNNNLVTVVVNGTKIIEQNNIRSEVNTSITYSGSASVPSAPFTTKLHEPIRLMMKIVSKGMWDGDAGQGIYDRKVEDLDGYRIALEGDGHKNFAVFRVAGLPAEPSLPAWGTP